MTSPISILPQIQNDPIYPLPFLYISGLNISSANATLPQLVVAPGQCRDGNDVIDMVIGNISSPYNPQPLFIDCTKNGLNGLDYGTISLTTDYAIYIIGDSRGYNPTGGLVSLTSNAYPLLPLGYDSIRLLGFATSNGSTGAFTVGSIRNMAYAKSFFIIPPIAFVTGGNATTFTLVNLSSLVPATGIFSIVTLYYIFTPASVGDILQLRPGTSTSTNGLVQVVGVQAGVPQVGYINVVTGIVTGAAQIQYKVSNASDSVNLSLYENTFSTQ
jgi:hypothetical protein